MAKKVKTKSELPVVSPDTAGADIGATEIYVAVPPDRSDKPVRPFGTFTPDLYAIADWLKDCGIRSISMESTGVYWIPLFQILEDRGFEVCLVNARHVKNVPGRKTDVSDCQWLQYLHAVGLLRGSFRPPQQVCAVRALTRHREMLIRMAASHVQHMQKALAQMNLQLHNVITDITGVTGLAILDAILSGERDTQKLAELRDSRIRATKETIAKSLVGDYRPELLFTLRQALQAYRHYQELIVTCDRETAILLRGFDARADLTQNPLPPSTAHKHKRRPNEPHFDLRSELYRVTGVDMTAVPGIQAATVHTIFAEIGRDVSRFPSDKHFASWLGLCPDNRISGGKILSVKTRHVKNRAATALRMAALTLSHSRSALGDFYRRMRAKFGAPKAITATAHKLARIIYHMLRTGDVYDPSQFARHEEEHRRRTQLRLNIQARALGFALIPL